MSGVVATAMQREGRCRAKVRGRIRALPQVMWLTAGMAAGDTFWLGDGSHYVIQRYRVAETTSAEVPTTWSDWASIGLKKGHADSTIECRGFFHDPGSTVYDWVDSIDFLIE